MHKLFRKKKTKLNQHAQQNNIDILHNIFNLKVKNLASDTSTIITNAMFSMRN